MLNIKQLSLVFALFMALNEAGSAFDINTPFVNNATFVGPDQFLMRWNYTLTDIVFKLIVKDAKWVGFGFSDNGDMDYADVVIGFFNPNGSANFTRRTILKSPTMYVNPNQQVTLMHMSSENDTITLVFSRKIKYCINSTGTTDINKDIISGTQHMIYAWGNSFAANGDIRYHGPRNRGSAVVSLLTTLNEIVDLDIREVKVMNFDVKTTLINNSTTEYYCAMFRIPSDWFDTKQHILRYETVFSNNTQYIHHWLFYECSDSYEKEYLAQTNGVNPRPGTCFPIDGNQQPNEWLRAAGYCQRISLLWAVGSPSTYDFPSKMAYPIGGPGSFKYFYLQVHYNNPNHDQDVVGDMMLRLYHTKNYRPTEIGILTVGTDANWAGIVIPPQMPKMSIDYYCRKEALQGLFSMQDNVTVIGVAPHTHLAGIQVFLKQIRNGQEVSYLTKNERYDFNYQTMQFLQEPIVISKNDELKSTCAYQSMDKTGYTLGGVATSQEMCMNFVWYYPRNPSYSSCYEIPTYADSYYFMAVLNATGEIKIEGDLNWQNINTALINAKPTNNSAKWFPDYYARSNRTNIFDANNTRQTRDYTPYSVLPIMEPGCAVVSAANRAQTAWLILSLATIAISMWLQLAP